MKIEIKNPNRLMLGICVFLIIISIAGFIMKYGWLSLAGILGVFIIGMIMLYKFIKSRKHQTIEENEPAPKYKREFP